jgi:hypothetical protein
VETIESGLLQERPAAGNRNRVFAVIDPADPANNGFYLDNGRAWNPYSASPASITLDDLGFLSGTAEPGATVRYTASGPGWVYHYDLLPLADAIVQLESGSPVARAADGTKLSTNGDLFNEAVDAALDAGHTHIHIRRGSYTTDPVTLDADDVTVTVEAGTQIQLQDDATLLAGNRLAIFYITGDRVELDAPRATLDFNKAGQDQAAYNAAGGSNQWDWHGVIIEGADSAHRVEDATVRVGKIKNVADRGCHAKYTLRAVIDVVVDEAGGCVNMQHSDDYLVERAWALVLDNTGWKTFPHFFDSMFCTGGIRNNLRLFEQRGSGVVADGTSLSNWNSGITILDDVGGSGHNWNLQLSTVEGTNKGVGLSLLGNKNLRVSSVNVEYYSECTFEDGGNTGCVFTDFTFDGHYNAVDSNGRDQHAHVLYNNAFYPDFAHRGRRYTDGNSYINFHIQRFVTYGLKLSSARACRFVNYTATACRDGLIIAYSATDQQDNFTIENAIDLAGHEFSGGCDFSYNEGHGVRQVDGSYVKHFGTISINNGQANDYPGGCRQDGTVPSSNPSGFFLQDSAVASGLPDGGKIGLEFHGVQACDTQQTGVTMPTNMRGSANPAAPTIVSVSHPSYLKIGQTLKFTGAGAASADLITRIDDVSHDEITLSDPILTFPEVAGTGTISSVGTAVTGAGTNFTGQFQIRGRYWLKAAGVYRQVNIVPDDTHLTLDVAFPSNLPGGTTFTIVEFPIVGLRTQRTGVLFNAQALSPKFFGGNFTGNAIGDIDDHLVRMLSTRPEWYGVTGAPSTRRGGLIRDVIVRTADANIGYTDDLVAVQLAVAATCTLTLPDPASYGTPGKEWMIVDEGGTAAQFTPIIVNDYAGAEVARIWRRYGSITVYVDSVGAYRFKREGWQRKRPEATWDITNVSNAATITSGQTRIVYFTAEETESITQLKVWVDSQAAVFSGVGTLCRLGVYTTNSSGDLVTKLASNVSDLTKLGSTQTSYKFTLSTTFNKKRGVRYAIAFTIVNTTGTAPNIKCLSGPSSQVMAGDTEQPRMSGLLSSQSDLPADGTLGSGLTNSSIAPYIELLP